MFVHLPDSSANVSTMNFSLSVPLVYSASIWENTVPAEKFSGGPLSEKGGQVEGTHFRLTMEEEEKLVGADVY